MITRRKGGARPTFYRAKKILALVPKAGVKSDIDESSESEPEIPPPSSKLDVHEDSDGSSSAPSLPSSFENLHILSDDDMHEFQETNFSFTPALAAPLTPLAPVFSPLTPAAPVPSPLTPAAPVPSPLTPAAPIPSPLTPRQNAYPERTFQRKSTVGNSFEVPPSSVQSITSSMGVSSPQLPSTRSRRPRIPSKRLQQRAVVRNKPLTFKWANKRFFHRAEIEDKVFPAVDSTKTPLGYFKMFLSENIINMIVQETNLYSTQETGKSLNVSTDDIKDFVAINLLMGIVKLPAFTDYWSHEYRYPAIADVMSLKKFQSIRRFIHFNNNLLDDGDRYFKIRPLIQMVRENFLKIPHETRFSIDEMMVPYKGKKAGSRKQYVKNKPKKWGFKIFVRAGVSGFVYDFIVYAGEDTFRYNELSAVESGLGLGAKVVIALCKSIPDPACSVVYFDNFFTSLELICHLREEMGIFSLGTIRSNRMRGAEQKLTTDKALKKKSRGSHTQVVCNSNKVCIVKWLDNKCVTTASSFTDAHPLGTILRYDKNLKRKTSVPCPENIKQYNAHMGGVDLADMLIALNRTEIKGHRWYLPLVSQILDMCLINSWILYRRENAEENTRTLSLKKFRYSIVQGLLKCDRQASTSTNVVAGPSTSKTIKAPVVPRPTTDVRLDQHGHFPIFGTKGRCKLCIKGQTMIHCSKCKLKFCLTPKRNCFVSFHTKM